MTNWLLTASSGNDTYVAKTSTPDIHMLYRAVSKWIIRKNASKILHRFWEYIDQDDNEIEDALLDQLETQATDMPDIPQTTNVRTKDYSIDMTVFSRPSKGSICCELNFILFVYFHSIGKKMRIDEKKIDLQIVNMDKIETINVRLPAKTPAPKKNPRTKKRNSKVTPSLL